MLSLKNISPIFENNNFISYRNYEKFITFQEFNIPNTSRYQILEI